MATLLELGAEYRMESARLQIRVSELEKLLDVATDHTEWILLRQRISMLKAMYRDTRDIAIICKRYYGQGLETDNAGQTKKGHSINQKFSTSPTYRVRADGRKRGGIDPDLAAFFREISIAQSDNAEVSELKRNLFMAIQEELTSRQMECMRLFYVKCLNQQEIAEKLGITRPTVSKTMSRGKERLRKCLRYGAAKLLVPDDRD